MLQVFFICADFSRLFLSAILYDLSTILQADRLAFRLYDALKFVVLVPLVFSQFYNIQNTADLRLYTKYELWSIESLIILTLVSMESSHLVIFSTSGKGHVKIIFLPVIALSFTHFCSKLEQTLHKHQEQHS